MFVLNKNQRYINNVFAAKYSYFKIKSVGREPIQKERKKALIPQPVLPQLMAPTADCGASKPKCSFGKLPIGKLHNCDVATWEIDTCDFVFGKMPLGKCPKLYQRELINSAIFPDWFTNIRNCQGGSLPGFPNSQEKQNFLKIYNIL